MPAILIPCATILLLCSAFVAHAAQPMRNTTPYASDAHRGGTGGSYGSARKGAPMRGAGDVRDRAKKEPYDYRYYSDTDRSPGSCRRYAQRAIATRNSNWWTRYTACLK